MTTLSPRDIVTQNIDLVSLPEIVIKLNEMVNDPLSTAADMGAVISQDPALSGRLLKIVNSSFYGFPSHIDSISLAITILGTRQLRDLVLATAVIRRFRGSAIHAFNIDAFWRHSLCCAVSARAFAGRLRVSNRERYFVAGLLHDIGKMVLYLVMPEQARELIQRASEPGVSIAELERQVFFGIDHAEVGAELLRQWRLPESLIEPVRFHHTPHLATQFAREAAVIHLANGIANTLQPVVPGEGTEEYDPRAWAMLEMTAEILDSLLEEVNTQLGETIQLLYYDQAA